MGKQGYIYNKSEDSEKANILIDGEIDSWWGVGLQSFIEDIASSDAKEIMVQINSGGGSVFEGQAIAAYIKGTSLNVNTSILGLCASIATFIAMAGKTTSISKGSLFMIHNASGGAYGESDDLRKTADLLDTIDDTLTNLYVDTIERNGKLINDSVEETKAQVIKWQDAETWFTAEQSVEHGFIQKVVEGVELVNKATAQRILNSCSKYSNVPTAFINNFQNIVNMADTKPTGNDEPSEKGILATMIGWFQTAEGKQELSNAVQASKDAEKTALEAAIALVKASGSEVVAKGEEAPEAKPKLEVEKKEEEPKAKTEVEILTAQLEAANLKAQKLEEENQGAPSATPKNLKAEEKSPYNKEQMGGFDAITNAISKLG